MQTFCNNNANVLQMQAHLVDLKNNGYKITPARKVVLDSLSNYPLTISEIANSIKEKGSNVDLVTVYRTVGLLADMGLVAKISFEDNIARYELVQNRDHHHHVVCVNCGSIEEVPLDEKAIVKQVENKSKFKVQRHNLEFFGHCPDCQDEK